MSNLYLNMKNRINLDRLTRIGPPAENSVAAQTLKISITERGNVSFTVWHNNGTAGADSRSYFEFSGHSFYTFEELFSNIINSDPGETGLKQRAVGFTYDKNSEEKVKIILGELWFGKTADGIIYISVTSEGKPTPAFKFENAEFYKYSRINSQEPLTASEFSKIDAKAWLKYLSKVASAFIVSANAYSIPATKAKQTIVTKVKDPTEHNFDDVIFE